MTVLPSCVCPSSLLLDIAARTCAILTLDGAVSGQYKHKLDASAHLVFRLMGDCSRTCCPGFRGALRPRLIQHSKIVDDLNEASWMGFAVDFVDSTKPLWWSAFESFLGSVLLGAVIPMHLFSARATDTRPRGTQKARAICGLCDLSDQRTRGYYLIQGQFAGSRTSRHTMNLRQPSADPPP